MLGYHRFMEWFSRPPTVASVALMAWHRDGTLYRVADPATLKREHATLYPVELRGGNWRSCGPKQRLHTSDLVAVAEAEARQYAKVHATAETRRPSVAAFTLIELLLVVGLIAVVIAVALPAVNRMMAVSRVDAAADSVGTMAASTRAYARVEPSFPYGTYRGSALVITPANEMRITRHVYDADGTARRLIDDDLAGYRDVTDEPYAHLTSTVGIVGIIRPNAIDPASADPDAPPALIPPPFAVRFSQTGTLYPSAAWLDDTQAVIYDNDNDGVYRYEVRPNGYDVAEWNPELVGETVDNWDEVDERWLFEFGALDSVLGVIVYDRGAFDREGLDLVVDGVGVSDEAAEWLLQNGEPVFFNRYTGSGIQP